MFCDRVSIYIKAGNGGDGAVSFLHEKYREYGGPDGGDGGKGGSVIFQGDENQNTLYYFKTHHKLIAENGERGKKKKSHGKNGQDLVIKVPKGTIIKDENERVIGDLSVSETVTVAQGGSGGFGNAHFTSSTRQAPRVAELGEPGEESSLILELKMIADVGLVGLPNVGKSTFLSVVSAAKPKIADYEFTTIIPNLGVVEEGSYGVERGFIVADIPGLIEGASAGKGLGDEFLRHIERTKILIHFLDATHKDLLDDYQVIRKELSEYDALVREKININLSDKPEIVVVNKIDVVGGDDLNKKIARAQKVVKSKIIPISGVTHNNISEVLHEVEKKLKKIKPEEVAPEQVEYKTFTLDDVVDRDIFEVLKEGDGFRIKGRKIERFAIRTDYENPHAIVRLRDIFKKMGIDKELKRHGAEKGDTIFINKSKFIL